jgi:hypothetical protein
MFFLIPVTIPRFGLPAAIAPGLAADGSAAGRTQSNSNASTDQSDETTLSLRHDFPP